MSGEAEGPPGGPVPLIHISDQPLDPNAISTLFAKSPLDLTPDERKEIIKTIRKNRTNLRLAKEKRKAGGGGGKKKSDAPKDISFADLGLNVDDIKP